MIFEHHLYPCQFCGALTAWHRDGNGAAWIHYCWDHFEEGAKLASRARNGESAPITKRSTGGS